MSLNNTLKIICKSRFSYNVGAKFSYQHVQSWNKCSCRFMSSRFSSPFQDHEVYDGDRNDLGGRDGPVLMQGNFADFMIIGGGVMGQSLAYSIWRQLERATPLKAYKTLGAGNLVIVEKDPTLHTSASALAVGGLRSQFSNSSNVKLSLQSSEFLRKIRLNLSTIRNPDPDVQFNHQGYLVLATKSGADQLMKNCNTQTAAGAKIMLFTKDQLQETFPWMKVDDIELGSYGLQHEGWFDPMSLVNSFKSKNSSFPIINITGEVVGFKKEIFDRPLKLESPDGRFVEVEEEIRGVYIKMKDYDKPVHLKCGKIFNCAGPWAGKVAELAGVGTGDENAHELLRHKLPVEPRKRYVYVLHCPDAPLLDLPFVVDPSGFYIRREGLGGKYICGMSPTEDQEPSTDNLDVDYDFFNDQIWPKLAERIPAFEKLKVVSAWAGYYDFNTFDQNAILGPHPYYHNFIFMNGFSGHGIQQACAAGDKLADLVLNGVDKNTLRHALDDFSFNRIIDNRPFVEENII